MRIKPRLLGKVLLGILLLLMLLLSVYIWRSFPVWDGEVKLQGLSAQVSIRRDSADVVHVEGQTDEDVYRTMGYVHARERSWQLEFNHRLMHGRLSEVLGEGTVEIDKLMRTLGIVRAAATQLERMPEPVKRAVLAYAQGINDFHASATQALPPEFHILGIRTPAKWEAVDSVAWALIMSLDLSGNWGAEFVRFSALQKLTTDELWELMPPYPGETRATRTDLAKLYRDLGVYAAQTSRSQAGVGETSGPSHLHQTLAASDPPAWVQAWLAELGDNAGKGSNNWVIAGNHSRSGKPLLANDPHLALGAPAIWYFAHLKSPQMEVIGATLPGSPFVVLGRTQSAAWGFTNVGNDVQDLYLEQINPENSGQYRVPSDNPRIPRWANFEKRVERIAVKGGADIELVVRATRHGPVVSDVQKQYTPLLNKSRYAMALRWASLDATNITGAANYYSNRAKDVAQLRSAFEFFTTPPQNAVMADTQGMTHYKAAGLIVARKSDDDIRGMAPGLGWLARYDWDGYLSYDQTPEEHHAQISARGWRATANQRIHGEDFAHFMGQDWLLPYRQNRIEALLAQTPVHTLQSVQQIQADTYSEAALKLGKLLAQVRSAHPLAKVALEEVRAFEGTITGHAAAPTIINMWAHQLTKELLIRKLGAEQFAQLYGKRQFRSGLEHILTAANAASWCAPKSCEDRKREALERTLDQLGKDYGADPRLWKWEALNGAISSHRPLSNVAILRRLFEIHTPVAGDAFTVNVAQYHLNQEDQPFATRHAASLRAVYDLADLEEGSRFIYQSGQSGLVFSGRYRDMAAEWSKVQYRELRMHPKAWKSEQTLHP